jgi:hypothetical protein
LRRKIRLLGNGLIELLLSRAVLQFSQIKKGQTMMIEKMIMTKNLRIKGKREKDLSNVKIRRMETRMIRIKRDKNPVKIELKLILALQVGPHLSIVIKIKIILEKKGNLENMKCLLKANSSMGKKKYNP